MSQNRRIITGLTIVFAALLVASCGNEKETPAGLKYTVVRAGDGKVAKPGEVVVMDIAVFDNKDSAYFDSRTTGMSEMFMVRPDSFKKDEYGIVELFRLASTGDSLVMTIPAKDFFERTWMQPVPAGVDPSSPFTCRVSTKNVLDSTAAMKMRTELYEKAQKKMQEEAYAQSSQQLAVDAAMIDEHLAAKNLKAETTPSGLRYIVKKKGTGPVTVNGQTATVEYKGYLLNGETFDEGSYSFPVGAHQVIQGWDEILLLMNKGTKLTVFIPSTLAYGNQRRSEQIMENTILAFDMELKDLK